MILEFRILSIRGTVSAFPRIRRLIAKKDSGPCLEKVHVTRIVIFKGDQRSKSL